MDDFWIQSLVYFLISFFLIHPPQEVQSAGFSIPSLFSSILGSEESFFIQYHIVRISITIAIHSLIPVGYFLVIGFYQPDLKLFEISYLNNFWRIYFCISVLITVGLGTVVFLWYMSSFENHPLARQLKKFSPNGQWKQIASQINNEFRHFDKFSSGTSFYNRVYLTDNWLIKVNLYSLKICPTSNLDVALTGAIDLNISTDGSMGRQLLKLVAKPLNDPSFEQFIFRLSSFEYQEFCEKLSLPIRQTCDIIIKQSLPEMFIDSFREQVMTNQSTIYQREELENCIGCMKKLADVKLVKLCGENSDCRICSCRPMWCLECMGKWFAYRQNQSEPTSWLSSKATCPTCRAKFCVQDVSPLDLI